jgi:anti-sigma factor RsiW
MSGRPMMDMTELSAFVDGELDAERMHAIEARTKADPVQAAHVAAYRADMAMLKQVYAPIVDAPLPDAWRMRVDGAKAVSRPIFPWRIAAAIAAVLLVVVGSLTYWPLQPSNPGDVVQTALDVRADLGHAVRVVPVGAGADTHQYDRALSAAVAMDLRVPDLTRMGYRLAGIRIYHDPSTARAAELIYRDAEDRRFTLYIRRSDGSARFDQFERNGLRVCVWQDEKLATVMAGDVSTAAMQRLASLAYTGLTL